jgi:hypothetical protein
MQRVSRRLAQPQEYQACHERLPACHPALIARRACAIADRVNAAKTSALFSLKSPFQVYPRALEPVTCLKGKDIIIATLCYGDGIEPFQ